MNREARIGIGIVGASGYIGAELLRYLVIHPQVDILWATANSRAGEAVSACLPNLDGFIDRELIKLEDLPADLAGARAVFVALPHNKSQEVIPALATRHPRTIFIDMGGDFRTPDPAGYREHYGRDHAAADWLDRFVFGFTEFQRPALAGARLIANPGCFATTLLLALAPLARAGRLRGDVFATGVTGSSGSGNVPSPTTHHPERALNFRSYKPLAHQHNLEVGAFLRTLTSESFRLHFVPQSGPFVRGVYTTVFPAGLRGDDLAAIFEEAYADEPLISLDRGSPDLRLVQGTPRSRVGTAGGKGQGAAFVVIDNLGKGAAGQAVQNLNRALGLEETLGLRLPGGFV